MNKNPFDAKKAYALSIGIGNRPEDSDAMGTTAADAKRISRELIGRARFMPEQVYTLQNEEATTQNVIEKLDKLAAATKENPADMVIIYFSGHGCVKDGNYYLVARDTQNADIPGTAISGSLFVEKLQAIDTDKMLVMLDCCHSGGIYNPADIPFEKEAILAKPNRVILSASHSSQVSYLSRPLSIFTYALVEGLAGKYFADGDTEVTLINLAMYIRERVYPLSGNKQQPQLNILQNAQTSDFAIVRYPNGEPRPAAFDEDFALFTSEGKNINTNIAPVRDDAFRDQFSWIINITGDDNIVLQDVKNSNVNINTHKTVYTTVINNYISSTENEEKFVFNEYLTKELLTAIAPFNANAKGLLDKNKDNPNWNQLSKESGQAKIYIESGYVAVIGKLLRKLIAIGMYSNDNIETKKSEYIEYCVTTAKRTLQLLCFACVSDIWNQKKEKDFILSAEQTEVMNTFFEYSYEQDMDILQYLKLFTVIFNIYTDHSLKYTIAELAGFEKHLQPGNEFYEACVKLNEINNTPVKEKYKLERCAEAEINVAHLLAPLGFFASYNMVSIKSVNYEEIRNTAPRYLHKFIELGSVMDADSKNAEAKAKGLKYVTNPVSTDSILLYKSNYMTGASINLFPFIVDYNALNSLDGSLDGAKICFYSSSYQEKKATEDEDDVLSVMQKKPGAATGNDVEEYMRFYFVDDNEPAVMLFKDILRSGIKVSEFLADDEKRKQSKFDNVFLQFKDAKETILGTTANSN